MAGAAGDSALSAVWALAGPRPTHKLVARALDTLDWPLEGQRARPGRPCTSTTTPVVANLSNKTLVPTMLKLRGWPLLPTEIVGRGGHGEQYTYAHFLWAICSPCVDWIDHTINNDTDTPWTREATVDMCAKLLAPDFACDTEASDETLEDMAEFFQFTVQVHLGITIPLDKISYVLGPLVHAGLPTNKMGVYLALMADVVATFVGTCLHDKLKCTLLAIAANIQEPTPTTPLVDRLTSELVSLLADKHKRNVVWESAPLVQDAYETPLKRRRTYDGKLESLEEKTEQIRMALVDKIATKHMPSTLVDAHRIIQRLLSKDKEQNMEDVQRQQDGLYSKVALQHHMLILDDALDAYTAERWKRTRDSDPTGWAVGVATDESPPSQARFGGYRFQVTVVYTPVWRPEHTWDDCRDPPLDAEQTMLDVCHCPGKDGPAVMAVLDKQLGRLGLSRYEMVNGTGDGGGENEGNSQGIHAIMESDVPGYVRRRCLGHLAWRVADAMLDECPHHARVKALCKYLGDGCTWTRLQGIATTPILEGGLALFGELSREQANFFGTLPGSIVQGRPESDKHFYVFLRGKEHVLHRVCAQDVLDRELCRSTAEAVDILGDIFGRVQRSVCGEMLHRAMYLHMWVNNHRHLSRETSLMDLSADAKDMIQDLSLTTAVIERLGSSRADIYARSWEPSTWVELAALLVYDDVVLAAHVLPRVLELHTNLASRGTAHLALVMENITRTTWLAGAMLHHDAEKAQTAANALHLHLLSTSPARRSAFETSITVNDTYMANLQAFATAVPQVCLWQGAGAYKDLFRFLALRFLLAPDQVLDCERAHARWQWLCMLKRHLSLKAMNAHLRLTSRLDNSFGEFPPPRDLVGHLCIAQSSWNAIQAQIPDTVAPRYRSDYPYLGRFNLRSVDLDIQGAFDEQAPAPDQSHPMGAYRSTCSVYLRQTFIAKSFHQLPGVNKDIFVHVLENKTLAGRELRDQADAQSRVLVLCFFERSHAADDELVVRRVDTSFAGMTTKNLTPAELLMHLGFSLAADPGRNALRTEALLEHAYDNLEHVHWTHEIVSTDATDAHVYKLTGSRAAEDVFWESKPLGKHTNIAIARRLERLHGGDRHALYVRESTAGLHAMLIAAEPGAAPPAGAGGGRGRGGAGAGLAAGHGRGRGRGVGPAGVGPGAGGAGRGGPGRGGVVPGRGGVVPGRGRAGAGPGRGGRRGGRHG